MSTIMSRYALANKLRMKDAPSGLTLEVKRQDLRHAKKKDPTCCGFAEACKRQEHCDAVFFFKSTAYVQKGNTLLRYKLPPSMQDEIVAFDKGGTFEPGEYILNKPSGGSTLAKQRENAKASAGRLRSGKRTTGRNSIRHKARGVRIMDAHTLAMATEVSQNRPAKRGAKRKVSK